jgi:carboxyl-terminal processing protease
MKFRGRLFVLIVSLPVIAFAVIGGFMGRAIAQEQPYRYLAIFEDVVNLVMNHYVEEIDPNKVMHGAMHGLADGLDPDSAYLDAAQAKTRRCQAAAPALNSPDSIICASFPRATARQQPKPACSQAISSARSTVNPLATPRYTKASACWPASLGRKSP